MRSTKRPSTTTYPTMTTTTARRPWQRGTTVPWWEQYRHGTRKPTTTTDPSWWLRRTQKTPRPSRSTDDWRTTRPTTSPSSYEYDGNDDYDEWTTTRRPTTTTSPSSYDYDGDDDGWTTTRRPTTTTSPSSYDWDGDDDGWTTTRRPTTWDDDYNDEYDWTTPWQPRTTRPSEDDWDGDNDYDWTTPWFSGDDYEERRARRLSRSGVILGGLIGSLVVMTIIVVILYLGFTRRHRPSGSATPLPFNSSLIRVDLEPTVNPAGPLLSAELPPYSDVRPPAYSSADVPPLSPEASVHVAGTPQVTPTPDESKAIAGQVIDV